MIPSCSELSEQKSVGPTFARRNGTFGYAIGAILIVGIPLANAVPMHTGSDVTSIKEYTESDLGIPVVRQTVLDSDLQSITPV